MAELALRRIVAAAVLSAMMGCGPAVSVADSGTTSEGSSTSTGSATTTSTTAGVTSLPPTTGEDVTTSPPRPGTTTTTAGDGSSEGESSTGEDSCSCAGFEIPFDAMTDEGFSAADMLEAATGLEIPMVWHAIADAPATIVAISVTLANGAIIDEPGGCCGFFLCGPCNNGLTVPVNITIVSEDGLLAENVTGQLRGDPGSITIESNSVEIAKGQGGWTTQAFEIKGTPLGITSIRIDAQRAESVNRQWIFVSGIGDDGYEQLGATEL